MRNLEEKIAAAVQHFWLTRSKQGENQGSKTGVKDAGSRAAVTGGAQMDGFVRLVAEALVEGGLPDAQMIETEPRRRALPGFFRPTKEWDLLVIAGGQLLAAIEFKSQAGSFGNNFNNRTEEALGNALDIRTAYREGAFKPSPKPWLGWFMLLEDAPDSTNPIGVSEPHFKVFPEFRGSSYAKRYELLCQKLVREQLYDAVCFMMSDREGGSRGRYREPSAELTCEAFLASLIGKACSYAKMLHEPKG